MPDLDKNSFEVATRFLLLVSLALLPLSYDYFHCFVLDIYIENCTFVSGSSHSMLSGESVSTKCTEITHKCTEYK